MPQRAYTICKNYKCNELTNIYGGYCTNCEAEGHSTKRDTFKRLDDNKTDEQRTFYSSSRWTKASKRKRSRDPLCSRCKERGIIHKADLVHHDPELQVLLAQDLNPFDDEYLFSLCNECHLEDLREKKAVI